MRKLIPLICLLLSACATSLSPEQIANADYGAPPPKNYQAVIKQYFEPTLIDPTSPLYTFSKPSKGYFREQPMVETKQMFGWKVCGTINSKNRFGGYTGSAPFIFLFRDGKIAQMVMGETDPKSGLFINPMIAEACNR